MLRGIVGIALPIARLEGKVKMSQNRPAADQAGVIDGLRLDGQDALATAVVRATGARANWQRKRGAGRVTSVASLSARTLLGQRSATHQSSPSVRPGYPAASK